MQCLSPYVRGTGFCTTLVLAILFITPLRSFSDILWDQQTGTGFSIGSTEFTQPNEDSSFISDDFFVNMPAWKITRVTLYGRELGDESFNQGVKLEFLTSPAHDNTATTYDGVYTISGINGRDRNLVFDFPTPLVLTQGTYWLNGWVVRPDFNDGGYWAWRPSKPVTLDEAFWHDPSGGSGLGTDPIMVSIAFGIPSQDARFTIEGTAVPEPSGAALLGALLVSAIRWRRRQTCATKISRVS